MRRRTFVRGVGCAALAGVVSPGSLRAQQPERIRRLGVLTWWGEYDSEGQSQAIALSQGLAKLGWTSGGNIRIIYRRASGEADRMARFAKELIDQQPDLIIGVATPAVTALLRQTRTIPIVFTEVSDPVGSGFVETLARPGDNVTGFVDIEASFGGKWVELLREMVPSLRRIALMFNPRTAPRGGTYYLGPFEAAARALAIEPVATPVHDPSEIASAMARLAREGDAGVIPTPDSFVLTFRDLIIAQAERNRLPSIYPYRFFATGGGLMSYGVDLVDQNRRAASYIDRILKGDKPGNLPVQLPTEFDLVINLKTANALGIKVPTTLLANADAVIE